MERFARTDASKRLAWLAFMQKDKSASRESIYDSVSQFILGTESFHTLEYFTEPQIIYLYMILKTYSKVNKDNNNN
jgi:hypothetical protein